MDIYSPQLKRYFLNRCLATVQNEKLRRIGTPPIPNPIIMPFSSFLHFLPLPLLSLLQPASAPVYTPVVSSPEQLKNPLQSTQLCVFKQVGQLR